MWRWSFPLALLLAVTTPSSASTSDWIPLRANPEIEAPVVSLLVKGMPMEFLRIEVHWAQVRQGNMRGWIRWEDLEGIFKRQNNGSPVPQALSSYRPSQPKSSGLFTTNRLQGLIDFTTGNYDLEQKMHDPYYRDRITRISSEWGVLYYWRTQHYYVRGVYLSRFFSDRLRFGLAKRRIYYNEIFGSSWSDEFIKTVIQTNRGWLSHEGIFGKGREYFAEVSFHF